MTREEAIKILKAIRVYECYPKSASEETKEAIDMAIEALQTEIVHCKDCRKQGSDDCPMFNREWRVIMQGGKCVDNFIFHDLTKPSGFCNYGERREP